MKEEIVEKGFHSSSRKELLGLLNKAIKAISQILLGKEIQVRLAVTSMVSRGHLLIEDLPGMGKTTLALSLAKVFGMSSKRIQFTSDVLPADIIGANVFNRKDGIFVFHPGPLFSQLVLADEINRSTPKTQSALLEAMEERQVSVDGQTRSLPDPFFVIATQNPSTQAGTFPLPESQLDRFLMRLQLGYPNQQAERELLTGEDRRDMIAQLVPVVSLRELALAQQYSMKTGVADSILDYIQRITAYTRQSADFAWGMSPRGALALLACAKTWAFLDNRAHVIPEDIQAVLPSVVEHRVRESADFDRHGSAPLSQRILSQVDIFD